jgi:hypothetical protein
VANNKRSFMAAPEVTIAGAGRCRETTT